MIKYANIIRFKKNHEQMNDPEYSEINNIISGKYFVSNRHKIEESKFKKAKYDHKNTVISIGTFEYGVSEFTVYGRNRRGTKLMQIYHKKVSPEKKQDNKVKINKVAVLSKRKFCIPDELRQQLRQIAMGNTNFKPIEEHLDQIKQTGGRNITRSELVNIRQSCQTPIPISNKINQVVNDNKKKEKESIKFTYERIMKEIKTKVLKIAFRAYKKKSRTSKKLLIYASALKREIKCNFESKIRKTISAMSVYTEKIKNALKDQKFNKIHIPKPPTKRQNIEKNLMDFNNLMKIENKNIKTKISRNQAISTVNFRTHVFKRKEVHAILQRRNHVTSLERLITFGSLEDVKLPEIKK